MCEMNDLIAFINEKMIFSKVLETLQYYWRYEQEITIEDIGYHKINLIDLVKHLEGFLSGIAASSVLHLSTCLLCTLFYVQQQLHLENACATVEQRRSSSVVFFQNSRKFFKVWHFEIHKLSSSGRPEISRFHLTRFSVGESFPRLFQDAFYLWRVENTGSEIEWFWIWRARNPRQNCLQWVSWVNKNGKF